MSTPQISGSLKLSKNFWWSEMYKTSYQSLILQNKLEAEKYISSISHLTQMLLQPIRDDVGMSLSINSCFRGLTLNEHIHGSLTSQHLDGEAGDYMYSSSALHNAEWHQRLFMRTADVLRRNNLMFGQLICETKESVFSGKLIYWLHISLGSPYRPLSECRQIFTMHNHKRTSDIQRWSLEDWR